MSKVTVVISQAQGRNPAKRQLEEDIATALIMEPGVDVSLVPHLYDMSHDHTGMLFLRSVPGPLIVLSWLYERAARWTLDRAGVRGHVGKTLLVSADDDTDEDDEEFEEKRDAAEKSANGIGSVNVPDRRIYCIDLRISENADEYLQEIRRIAGESSVKVVDLMSWIGGTPEPQQLQRYLQPERMLEARRALDSGAATHSDKESLPEDTSRRWYPVIDYSRCTNCMECIDFCLFGVYGVDALDRILVEQQDNCKKGCPACSRVCPENAIIFPQHKTPAIAGAEGEIGGLKIDLSQLFGGESGESAVEMAVKERDSELILAGRNAVGMSVGIRQAHRDEIDQLIEDLDALEF
jgi:Pyruvate/2-oxoacid:ferredoxin oxidoreductase delta subunit